jgi:hypothetical protein
MFDKHHVAVQKAHNICTHKTVNASPAMQALYGTVMHIPGP